MQSTATKLAEFVAAGSKRVRGEGSKKAKANFKNKPEPRRKDVIGLRELYHKEIDYRSVAQNVTVRTEEEAVGEVVEEGGGGQRKSLSYRGMFFRSITASAT